jgi:hypothetical protein
MIINNYSELLQGDKVRAKTPPEINQAIDIETAAMIRFYAGKTDYEISKRIEKLDNEWDIGRCIEGRAAIVSFIGVILGLKKSKKWLILSIIALTFLLQYAIHGWCPPVALLRRFGIRTRQEIYLEKYALQVLCRDFHHRNHRDVHHEKHHHRSHHNEHGHESNQNEHGHESHHNEHGHESHHNEHGHESHHNEHGHESHHDKHLGEHYTLND